MLIETKDLTKRYPAAGRKSAPAVDRACITVARGETVGLFGESGSGKSTLGMMLSGLLKPTSGAILLDGEIVRMPYRGALRRRVQVLFQHPEVSFNPALPLKSSMTEPYRVLGERLDEARLLAHLAAFGLHAEHLQRLPAELSGGELQRAALARILVLQPDVLVLDEPTSMLDVITQAQIMELLRAHQSAHQTAYLLISHNRALCESACSRMYRVENGVFTEEKA